MLKWKGVSLQGENMNESLSTDTGTIDKGWPKQTVIFLPSRASQFVTKGQTIGEGLDAVRWGEITFTDRGYRKSLLETKIDGLVMIKPFHESGTEGVIHSGRSHPFAGG